MDDREQGQRWLLDLSVSAEPAPYLVRQPAPLHPGFLGNEPLFWQGHIGTQQPMTLYPWEASEWHAPPETQYGEPSGTSSQTPRTKRRRRSSSFDEGVHLQGRQEGRGREQYPPPAQRQRVASSLENDWATRGSSGLPAETKMTRRTSRSLSPERYHAPQGGRPLWGGEIVAAPSSQWSWDSLNPTLFGNLEHSWNYNVPSQTTGALMSSASSSRPLQPDDGTAEARMGWDHAQYLLPVQPRDWNASQTWNGYNQYPEQEQVLETPWRDPPSLGGAYQENPPVHDYMTMQNIANAGNVFTGANYGNIYMDSAATQSADGFMMNLASRLKVCFRADHMYYAEEETSLLRGQCTPGTRTNIIIGIIRWAINMSRFSEGVYWLSGQAGAGKTTIAFTIARQLETAISNGNSKVILGGSFFCSRLFLDTRSASSIVRTIVYQLALRSKAFQTALKEYGRFETVNHGPRSQLMGLLVEPWAKSAPERLAKNEPCYILPIDALDELEGTGGTEFLGTLIDVVDQQDLSGLKFFVTSRSEPVLVKRIMSFPNKQICRLEEVPLEESSADIKLYLYENLLECTSELQIQQLVSDAAGLFIYAATVVEYVKGRDIEEQKCLLVRLLATSSSARRPSPAATAKLDSLYLQILETCLVDPRERDDPEAFQDCLSILHSFVCTIERTSTSIVIDILNASGKSGDMVLDIGTADGLLHRLHAVLYRKGGMVMTFHKSFADFLFDERRSQRFFCNQEQHHRRLADGCFRIMAKQLRFNIANIPSSYQLDRDNHTLPTSVDNNIPASLRYACGNWSSHLILTHRVEALDGLAETVHKFLQLRVLFWMESMNLLGHRGRCQGMLRDAQQRFSRSNNAAGLVTELADATAFAAYHSASKAALSTPHLYLSSLATFPRHSTIVQSWRQQMHGIPRFVSAHVPGSEALVAFMTIKDRVNALGVSPDGVNIAVGSPDGTVGVWGLFTGEEAKVLKGHSQRVTAVAYSPDGTYIISGSQDETLRLWDLATGEEGRVLKGHTGGVNAVAYSPDGTHVVSGSWDKSVRVWDLSTGDMRSLKGHAREVNAVAYSPDGTHVASGASDKLVRVWDICKGEEVRHLEGHTNLVWAVTYSPDGAHIISGSSDRSVRLWDSSTGKQVMVLKGHGATVQSVACSPDGTHVISGSGDKSVRVWDLSTGKVVRALEGCTGSTLAVAYLPDGTRIVSVSSDSAVRVWDLSIGEEKRDLEGHTKQVKAVAYSPDGTYVVSGSKDKSVRIWDLSTGNQVVALTGHAMPVNAVAYSPDGTHIVSGSDDKCVRLWNTFTGRQMAFFNGHTDIVKAVAYSPHGNHIVSGSGDRSLRVWDLFTGEEVKILKGHTKPVVAVAYSPDGNHVVSGSWDTSVRVWDLSTGEEERVLRGHIDIVQAVAYSPDGSHVISGSGDEPIRVWDLSTGKEVRVLIGHTNWVSTVAYLPNGTHIVSGSYDGSVRVWDLSTGDGSRVFKGHTSVVTAVACSPQAMQVASGSDDKSVRVWDILTEHPPLRPPERPGRKVHRLATVINRFISPPHVCSTRGSRT